MMITQEQKDLLLKLVNTVSSNGYYIANPFNKKKDYWIVAQTVRSVTKGYLPAILKNNNYESLGGMNFINYKDIIEPLTIKKYGLTFGLLRGLQNSGDSGNSTHYNNKSRTGQYNTNITQVRKSITDYINNNL